MPDAEVAMLAEDYRQLELAAADRAMLDYVAKLTITPSRIEKADVEHLRQAGFSDSAILDICQVACYYAFVNRLADGLGVEVEEYMRE